jgi:hypothetical protein
VRISDLTEGERVERGPMRADCGRLKRGGKRERRIDGGGTFVGGIARGRVSPAAGSGFDGNGVLGVFPVALFIVR